MTATQLILAVMNLPLADMEALQAVLPKQIHYRKLECAHLQKETAIAENVVDVLQLAESPSTKKGPGRKPSINGAQSLIVEFLRANGSGSRKDVHSYCLNKNPDLSHNSIDNAGDALAKKNILTKCYGTWKCAA